MTNDGTMTEPRPSPTRLWLAAALVLLVYLVLAWLARIPGVAYSNDDSIYLFLARSLLEGSYRDIHLPGQPFHLQYPPGWPAVLAVATAVLGDRPELFVVIPLAFSVAGLALVFDIARRSTNPTVALATLVLASLNPFVVRYGGRLMGEAAMFFFAMLALWAISVPKPTTRRLLVACVAAVLAAFMRSAGIAVIGAIFVYFLWRRQWKWALGLALGAAATFGPWLVWTFVGPDKVLGRSYAADLATVDAARAAASNRSRHLARLFGMGYRADRYLSGHLHAVMTFPVSPTTRLDNVAWYGLLALIGLPGAVVLWRRQRALVFYVTIAFAVLVVWTWSDRRFLHPLMPLVALAFMTGASAAAAKLAGASRAWIGPVALLAVLLPRATRETAGVVRVGLRCDRGNPIERCFLPAPTAFLRAALWARSLPDTAVVLAEREAAFVWHSGGHRALHASEALRQGPEGFVPFLEANHVTHLLITQLSMNERVGLAAALNAHCDRLELLQSFEPNTHLFRWLPAPAADPSQTCRVTEELDRIGQSIRERVESGEIDE